MAMLAIGRIHSSKWTHIEVSDLGCTLFSVILILVSVSERKYEQIHARKLLFRLNC